MAMMTESKLSDNPTFAMTVDHPDPVDEDEEEDYQLTSSDAPKFVTKFEIPETELEPLEEVQPKQVELIQPIAAAPETPPIVLATGNRKTIVSFRIVSKSQKLSIKTNR